MQITLIGLPQSGKTTILRALTRGAAPPEARGGETIAVAKVPDARLDVLAEMFRPKKYTPADVTYVDVGPVSPGLGKSEGIGGQLLQQLGKADALAHVVRAFANDIVAHVAGSVDAARDIESMNLELAFSDLSVISRRLERLDDQIKKSKPADRAAYLREQELLGKLHAQVEAEKPLREVALSEEEERLLRGFGFLTAKPLLILLNIAEADIPRAAAIEAEYAGRFGAPGVAVAAICGQIEMELAQLGEEDASAFREELGLAEPAADRVIQLSYALLGLHSFLTAGPDEVRAWPIRRGTVAQRAAGTIHSDIERGFIRAEVVPFVDLAAAGSLPEAKRRGQLRLEGKQYVMQDGDVVNFLFNV
jgi:GTP-binding protein YchF